MSTNDLLDWLRPRGIVASAEVRAGLGVNAMALSRLVRAAGPEVVRLGRGRATRYALANTAEGLPAEIPMHRVDVGGRPRLVANLLTVANGASCIRHADGTDDGYVGLPPLIHDMAPAGYLGRRFASRHADLGLPPRLQDWADRHRLRALAFRGEDTPGDVILGEESLQRFLDSGSTETTWDAYPELADRAAEGGAASSAAGEQPKFTAFVEGRHCIVKFTIGDGSPTDERWRDLLACEALAARTLGAASIRSVECRTMDVGRRRFLETVRFDREGPSGRVGVLSLGVIDDEYFGDRDNWQQAADRLRRERLIGHDDRRRLLLLEAFGILIGNSDRHFGNICFLADELASRPTLELAPAFDMLPMSLAPNAGGVPHLRHAPSPRANLLEVWDEAADLAHDFWSRVSDDDSISDALRAAASSWAATVPRL